MNDFQESGFNNEISAQPQRTNLLTTTCILTWICCALLFASSLIGLFTQPSKEKQLEQIEKFREFNPDGADAMEEALAEQGSATQIISQVITIICLVLSAFGAWMMWNLKKIGFFIYLAGEIIPYSGYFIASKSAFAALNAMSGMGDSMMVAVFAFLGLADLIFIIMYAVNLKHMK